MKKSFDLINDICLNGSIVGNAMFFQSLCLRISLNSAYVYLKLQLLYLKIKKLSTCTRKPLNFLLKMSNLMVPQ